MASEEGLSHLPCCLCLQQERKSLSGWFFWSWPRESSRDAQQDAAGSTGLMQLRGCARGGRKKRRQEGCPAVGQHCSSTSSEDHSLSSQCTGSMFVHKDALLGTGSWTRTRQLPTHPTCPPSFSISTWQLDRLHSFFFFLSFSHAEIQPIHQTCPEEAQLLLMGDPHSKAPVGCLPPAQCRTCPVQPPTRAGSSCPFPAQQSLVQEGFFGLMAIFASAAVAGREAAGTQGPQLSTSTSLSQPSLPTSALWRQIWALTCIPSLTEHVGSRGK